MAFSEADIEEFIAALQQDPQLRDRVRNAILADDFLALPGLVRALTARIDRLTEGLDRLVGIVGALQGGDYEHRYIRNLGGRLGPHFRSTKLVSMGDVDQLWVALEDGRITEAQWKDLALLDFLATGRVRGSDNGNVLIAGELSIVIDASDVERARRRADIIASAGLDVVPVVDGESILRDALRRARELGVRTLTEREPVAD